MSNSCSGPTNAGRKHAADLHRRLAGIYRQALDVPPAVVIVRTPQGRNFVERSYRVPGDVAGDVCEYPLARNLISLAVALASELLVRL